MEPLVGERDHSMSQNHTVTITIRASNLSDSALKEVVADLGQVGAASARVSGQLQQVGVAATQTGGRFRSGALEIIGFGSAAGVAQAGTMALLGGLRSAAGGLWQLHTGLENTRARLLAFTKDGAETERLLGMIQEEAAKSPFAFGEMADAVAGLLPAAKVTGAALEELIDLAQILAASNPAEGLAGAAFALREALSGDFTSVIERFNLSRVAINDLRAQGVPALEAVSTALRDMGLDMAVVTGLSQTTTGQISTLTDRFELAALALSKPWFDEFKRGLSSAMGATEGAHFDARIERWTAASETLAKAFGSVAGETLPALVDTLESTAESIAITGEALGTLSEILGNMFPPEAQEKARGWQQALSDFRDAAKETAFDIARWTASGGPLHLIIKFSDDYEEALANLTARTSEEQRAAQNYREELINVDLATRNVTESTNNLIDALERKPDWWFGEKAAGDLGGVSRASASTADELQHLATQAELAGAQGRDAMMSMADGLDTVTQASSAAAFAADKLAESHRAFGGALDSITGVMDIYATQRSQFQRDASAMEQAYDILIERQKNNIELTAEQVLFLENYERAHARAIGGVEDATIAEGMLAEAKQNLVIAQEELAKAIARGEENLEPYLEDVQKAGDVLNGFQPDSPMKQAIDAIAEAISGDEGLIAAIKLLPQEIAIAVDIAINGQSELDKLFGDLGGTFAGGFGGGGPASNALPAGGKPLARYTIPVGVNVQRGPFDTFVLDMGEMAQGEHDATATAQAAVERTVFDTLLTDLTTFAGRTYAATVTTVYQTSGTPPGGVVSDGGGGGGSKGQQAQGLGGLPAVGPEALAGARDSLSNAQEYAALIDELVRALGEIAAREGSAVEAAKAYASAARTVLDVFSTALDLTRELGQSAVVYGDVQEAAIAALKFLTEKAVASLGDSAALYSGEYLEHLTVYADAARGALGVVTDAVALVRELDDTTIVYGEWQAQAVANLKFIAEKALSSIGDSAAIYAGPYLEQTQIYADAAASALSVLQDALELVEALRDTTALATVDMGIVTRNAATLAAVALQAATAFGGAAATWRGGETEQLAAAVADATRALADTIALLDALGNGAAAAVKSNHRLEGQVAGLAEQARTIAARFADAAAGWDDAAGPAMSDLAEAVSAATRALTDTLDLLAALDTPIEEGTKRAVLIERRVAQWSADARVIADAFAAAADGWRGEVNPAVEEFAEAAGHSLDVLAAVPTALEAILAFGATEDRVDVAGLSQQMAADVRIMTDALLTIADDYTPLQVEALATFAEGAGQGVALMGETARAMTAIAETSRLSEQQMQVFYANFLDILELIAQMAAAAEPYAELAADLAATLEDIADAIGAAAEAVGDAAGDSAKALGSTAGATNALAASIGRGPGGRGPFSGPPNAGGGAGTSSDPTIDALISSLLGFDATAQQLADVIELVASQIEAANQPHADWFSQEGWYLKNEFLSLIGGAIYGQGGGYPSLRARDDPEALAALFDQLRELAQQDWVDSLISQLERQIESGTVTNIFEIMEQINKIFSLIQGEMQGLFPIDTGSDSGALDAANYAAEQLALLQEMLSNPEAWPAAATQAVADQLAASLADLGILGMSQLDFVNTLLGAVGVSPLADLPAAVGQAVTDAATVQAEIIAAAVAAALERATGQMSGEVSRSIGNAMREALSGAL
jgi:hypothetical protein